jgi:dCMP deaminase
MGPTSDFIGTGSGFAGDIATDAKIEKPSPPAKRVRTDDDTSGGGGAASTISGRPAFLTPPTSSSIPATASELQQATFADAAADGTITQSSTEERMDEGDFDPTPSKRLDGHFLSIPRGGRCDSGRTPLGLMSRLETRALLKDEAGYDVDNPSNVKRREGYLSWGDYFLAVASLSAQRSKDPHSQVGACIVDEDNRIVGIGYNGFPSGCSDDCLPWADANVLMNASRNGVDGRSSEEKKDGSNHLSSVLHTRDPYMCHAEVNAILNKCSADVDGCRMYVTRFPSNDCAKVIIQSRMKEDLYLEEGTREWDA